MAHEAASQRDKSAKFMDLAPKRVTRAIKDLRLVANLGNRKNYQFTDEQARKIVRALQKELDLVKAAFSGVTTEGDDVFKF